MHWGVPKAMLSVHAWLLMQSSPQPTDAAMAALKMSRGRAHTVLQELVDWKLVYPIKRIGTRQITYVAEADPWTMMVAIIQHRKERELQPLMELAEWNKEHKAELMQSGLGDFHVRLSTIVNRASQVNEALDHAKGESEPWWWRWLMSPLRTK